MTELPPPHTPLVHVGGSWQSGAGAHTIPLLALLARPSCTNQAVCDVSCEKLRKPVKQPQGGRTARGTTSLAVAELSLQPGDSVEVFFEATDTNTLSGPGVAASARRTLTMYSPEREHDALLSQLERLIDALIDIVADRLESPVEERRAARLYDYIATQQAISNKEGLALTVLEQLQVALRTDPLADDAFRAALKTAYDAIGLMVVVLVLLSVIYPEVGEFFVSFMQQPLFMNATFYWVFAGGLTLVLLGVLIKARFNYWEIKNNELVHYHGLLGDTERWPAPNMRVTKEIRDVMEYLLCRSGRLVLIPSREPRAIVLDNVVGISNIEVRMQRLLNTLRVDHIED